MDVNNEEERRRERRGYGILYGERGEPEQWRGKSGRKKRIKDNKNSFDGSVIGSKRRGISLETNKTICREGKRTGTTNLHFLQVNIQGKRLSTMVTSWTSRFSTSTYRIQKRRKKRKISWRKVECSSFLLLVFFVFCHFNVTGLKEIIRLERRKYKKNNGGVEPVFVTCFVLLLQRYKLNKKLQE